MIDKKSITTMVNDVFRRGQGYPDKRLMHPQREWAVGLLMFAILSISGSVMAGTVFVKYKNIDLIEGDAGNAIPRYRGADVQRAVDLYQKRAEHNAALQNEKPQAAVVVTAVDTGSTTASSTLPVENLVNSESETEIRDAPASS